MGYFREIFLYQNPNFKETQLVALIKNLENDGWSLKGRWDNDNISYSINPGDWISFEGSNYEKALEDLSKLSFEKSFGGIQIKHNEIDRIAWLYQYEGMYRFELNISSAEFKIEPKLFRIYYAKLKNSIEKLKNILHIEWRTHYSNDIVRIQTSSFYQEVMILASSNKLKEYFSKNRFTVDFPKNLDQLLQRNIIIAINCLDYRFETIVEVDKFTTINNELRNSIEFEQNDEFLLMHYEDFIIICDKHNGDHKRFGKKTVISIEIEPPSKQEIVISRSCEKVGGQLIFQFNPKETRIRNNKLIEIDEIPTHNLS